MYKKNNDEMIWYIYKKNETMLYIHRRSTKSEQLNFTYTKKKRRDEMTFYMYRNEMT